jgi:predicted metalloprotease
MRWQGRIRSAVRVRRLSLFLAVMLTIIVWFGAASCGGGSPQPEGGEKGAGKGARGPVQQGQKVFDQLPQAEPAQASEALPPVQVQSQSAPGNARFDPSHVASRQQYDYSAGGQQSDDSSPAPTVTFEAFVRFIFNDLDGFWNDTYSSAGWPYSSPIVLIAYEPIPFKNAPGCGQTYDPSNNGPGPIYCAENSTIYLPPNWRVPTTGLLTDEHGDFALAYTVAHEWGHHLQNLVGLSGQDYPIKTGKELQADCLAGVWANSTYYEGTLEPGDFEEAMSVASALGDDMFGVPAGQGTHGSAEERRAWFRYGYDTGDSRKCVVQ